MISIIRRFLQNNAEAGLWFTMNNLTKQTDRDFRSRSSSQILSPWGKTYGRIEKQFYVICSGQVQVKVDEWYGEFEVVPSDPDMISVEFDPNP